MATVAQGFNERDALYSQNMEYEPDNDWKNDVRMRIQDGLQHLVDEARQTRDAEQTVYPVNDHDRARNEAVKQTYMITMTSIRRLAQEQYEAELERERQQRRWAAGGEIDPGWSKALLREQESIWAAMKKNNDQDNPSSHPAFGGSTNAVAGPSRIGLDGYIAGDGSSSARHDFSGAAFDESARHSRWTRSSFPVHPQTEWPVRRDGETADPYRVAVLERWIPREDMAGSSSNAVKNSSKLGRAHISDDVDKPVESSRRGGKQIATDEYDVRGSFPVDDLRSVLADAQLQLALDNDLKKNSQVPRQMAVQFPHTPHLYDRAQSITPRPGPRPASRMASSSMLQTSLETPPYEQSVATEMTRTDSYLLAVMQTTNRASTSTPHPSGQTVTTNTTINMQVVDPRTFTVDDETRSIQSPYRPALALPDFRPPPPVSAQSSSSSQATWHRSVSRSEPSQPEQKSPKSDEMVVVASDEGDSDWEAAGFDKEELEKMIEAEVSNMADDADVTPTQSNPTPPDVEPRAEETPIPGALPEEPEEIKAKAKGGKGKKKEEVRRKELEAKRREEETKRKAEETKRKEADMKRKEEEAKRREEIKCKAEEAKRKEDEAKRVKDEESKQKLVQARRVLEEKKKAEQLRRFEEEQRRLQEEEARRAEEDRKEEEQRRREEEAMAEKLGKERLEAFRKQQEALRRRVEGRQRTDSTTRPPPELAKQTVTSKDEREPAKKSSEPEIKKRMDPASSEEEVRLREERLRVREEECGWRERALKLREEEVARRQKEEEVRLREEDKKRKPGAPRTKADELRDKERDLRRLAEDNLKKELELRKREEAINRRAEEILTRMKAQQEEFRKECLLMGMTLSSSK